MQFDAWLFLRANCKHTRETDMVDDEFMVLHAAGKQEIRVRYVLVRRDLRLAASVGRRRDAVGGYRLMRNAGKHSQRRHIYTASLDSAVRIDGMDEDMKITTNDS